MHEQIAQLPLRVGDGDAQPVRPGNHPGVADLAAAFAVERRLVQHHRDLGPGVRVRHRLPADHQRQDLALGPLGGVAEELAGADGFLDLEPHPLGRRLARAGPRRARPRPLLRHRRVEPGEIDPAPLLAQRVLRQVDREAERVVQPERDRPGQRLPVTQPRGLLGQQAQPAFQRLAEPGFLQQHRLDDQRLGAAEFRIRHAHLPHQHRHQPVKQRVPRAHHVRVPHRPAHDPAQHVAAPLVRRQHPVGDQERGGAQMVGHHAMAGAERPVRVLSGRLGAGQDQRPQRVGVVVVVLALQDRGDALQPHAGVDRGPRQVHAMPGRAFLDTA